MENLLMDFHEEPAFVHELLNLITDYNIAQGSRSDEVRHRCGLFWRTIGGQAARPDHGVLTYGANSSFPASNGCMVVVREANKNVFIHSCGDVDELFDELIAAGVNCFNPFQPRK